MNIYLAGAMDKVPPEFAITWRQAAKKTLIDHGHMVFDPTVGKDLWDDDVHTKAYTPTMIVNSDLAMIKKSDIIIAEISRENIPYHGTSMELVYSYQWGKDIYVWGGCKSYWVRYHATQIFDKLEDILTHILYD